ncbi:hypothetical protein B7494_g5012 [Chlorociboria aeruginascens]|nr:hypothetical protein B7494_g5012 [Chlorociboria aeruginascens]
MAQPSEEAINTITGLANNCNTDQAVNQYFDETQEEKDNKWSWSETQFSSDRAGDYNNHGVQGISFNIQSPDEPSYSTFDGPLSRPPSRASHNKSPLSKVIDLSDEHAAAGPRHLLRHDDQDPELHAAIAASRVDQGLPPQESGVTGTDRVYFGPAERGQYEEGKWDMVPLARTSAQEIVLDPEPEQRKRQSGSPAFLKPSAEHRLGAILTIYHEIPLAREIFLDRLDTIPDYGSDKEWWTGAQIELPTTTHQGDVVIQREDSKLSQEVQRLMAFLDKTDRSYGSADALARLPLIRELYFGRDVSDLESAFFSAYESILEGHGQFRKLFSIGVASEVDQDTDKKPFAILDLNLPRKDSIEHETLYDIADDTLWIPPAPLELEYSAYLSHIANVIAFRLTGNDSSKSIDIPIIWYPDRYLKSGREAALDMRLKKNEYGEKLRSIIEMEDNLTFFQVRGRSVKVRDMFTAALRHDQECEVLPENTNAETTTRGGEGSELSAGIRKVLDSIDEKLKVLNEEKEKTWLALKQLSKLYTKQSDDPEQPILHPYTLRGVSASKDTTYICRRAEPDLIEMSVDNAPPMDQWWRIHFATSGFNPVTVEKTTEEKVLETLRSNSQNPILVYADEKAMSWPSRPLPLELEKFVLEDNKLFKDELNHTLGEDLPPLISPKSPGKRKYQDGSESPSAEDPDEVHRAKETSKNLIARLGLGNGIAEDQHKVIMGVDPSAAQEKQEMQELGRMSMLSRRPKDGETDTDTVDGMDLDLERVMEDEHTTEESAAVKHVEYA